MRLSPFHSRTASRAIDSQHPSLPSSPMGSANPAHHQMPAKPPSKRAAVDAPLLPPSQPLPLTNPHPEPLLNPSPLAVHTGRESCYLPCTPAPLLIDGASEGDALRRSEILTVEEVLRRRSRRLKQLSRYYRAQYWAMMEEVRRLYRDYYWKYGKSPVEEDGVGVLGLGNGVAAEDTGGGMANGVALEEMGETGRGVGFGEGITNAGGRRKRESVLVEFHGCSFPGCKAKAMALTTYCHQHILSDPRQTLYKACKFVIKSAQTGRIFCGKPVLRSAMPSFCPVHFQKAQRHVSQALKKAGLTTSSSSKLAPKFHVVIAECVCQIRAKRRAAQKTAKLSMVDKDEHVDSV